MSATIIPATFLASVLPPPRSTEMARPWTPSGGKGPMTTVPGAEPSAHVPTASLARMTQALTSGEPHTAETPPDANAESSEDAAAISSDLALADDAASPT